MTDEELFLKEGAFYMCHRLIYRQKDVGVNQTGTQLVLTLEGEEEIARLKNITDVEVKPARAKKVKVEETVVDEIDDLLG